MHSQIFMYGLWTTNAKYREDFTTTGAMQFEIKIYEGAEYVLVEPENNVISYKNLQDFKINIKASCSFLSVSWPDSYKTLFVGRTLSITVTPESPYVDNITHYNYLVSSKGKVVHFGIEKKLPGLSSQLLNLPLSQHMAPTACLLVYYFVTGIQTTDLVSDSVCLKSQEKCGNQLQIHLSPNKDAYSPDEDLSLTVETQSESWVVDVA
ncbi:complement C5-like [Sorex fumeus]|uniref:complement C5-like n=1 Tax=Sorex fumeus TaxID=62283 RepID=UPI0024AD8373|nr:complement C5-like [Sorex fumeus]